MVHFSMIEVAYFPMIIDRPAGPEASQDSTPAPTSLSGDNLGYASEGDSAAFAIDITPLASP